MMRSGPDADREEALARAAGIPTKWSEFPRHAPTQDAENAAIEYREAMSIKEFVPSFGSGAAAAGGWHEWYAQCRPQLESLIRGAKKPHCDFGYKIPLDQARIGKDATPLVMLVSAATREARLEASGGHAVKGLHLLAQVAPVAGHLSETPNDLMFSDAQLCAYSVCRSVQAILRDHWMEPGVPEATEEAVRRVALHTDPVQMLEQSTLNRIHYLGRARQVWGRFEYPNKLASKELLAESYIPGMIQRWKASLWRSTRREVAAMREASGDWVKLDRDLDRIYKEETSRTDGLFLAKMTGNPAWWVSTIPRFTAIRRVTDQAAAVLKLYGRTGKFPASLPLLGDELTDPRLNSQIRYEATRRGFVIQAAGDRGVYFRGAKDDLVRFEFVLPKP